MNLLDELDEDRVIIHIGVQQWKNKKYLTSVEGLDKIKREDDETKLDEFLEKLCRQFKKQLHCNANVKENNCIQLNGDHRQTVKEFLIKLV